MPTDADTAVAADAATVKRMGLGMTIHGPVDKVVVMEDSKEE